MLTPRLFYSTVRTLLWAEFRVFTNKNYSPSQGSVLRDVLAQTVWIIQFQMVLIQITIDLLVHCKGVFYEYPPPPRWGEGGSGEETKSLPHRRRI